MVDCIPEVLTLLLTPILACIHMVFDLHTYVNMGVKRSVRNAANQLNYPAKIFLGPTTEISYFLIFPLYFSEFPYILGGLSAGGIHKKIKKNLHFPIVLYPKTPIRWGVY